MVPTLDPTPRTQTLRDETVDDLLSQLESIRSKKAEIERREWEVVEKIKKRVAEQNERLKKAGIGEDKKDTVENAEQKRIREERVQKMKIAMQRAEIAQMKNHMNDPSDPRILRAEKVLEMMLEEAK